MSKVIAIVSFMLPQKQTLEQATATFQATAPKYLNMRSSAPDSRSPTGCAAAARK